MRVVSSLVISLLFGSLIKAQVLPKKSGIQTLVLLDDYSIVETHSIFFDSMRKDGHDVHYEMITPNAPSIKYYEEYYYDNIILMAPSLKGNFHTVITRFRVQKPSKHQWSEGLLRGWS
jgi:hypothetical protein